MCKPVSKLVTRYRVSKGLSALNVPKRDKRHNIRKGHPEKKGCQEGEISLVCKMDTCAGRKTDQVWTTEKKRKF